jgi:arylformamidase
MSDVYLWSHVGTHVEAPLHFFSDGKDTAALSPEIFVGPAIRIDLRHKATNEPITVDDLRRGGAIREGDRVFLWEGRDRLYRQKGSHDRPFVTEEAGEWLVLDRKIRLLGTDSSGFEVRGGARDHPNHRLFLSHDVPIVECLTNLGGISANRFFFVGLPWPVRRLDASPIRAVAIEGLVPVEAL